MPGFSRGAYQARVLAGMIQTVGSVLGFGIFWLDHFHKVGLLYAGNEEQIPLYYIHLSLARHNLTFNLFSAYQMYVDSNVDGGSGKGILSRYVLFSDD